MNIIDIYKVAVQCHKDGDIEHAKKLYLQVLEAYPNNANTIHKLGVIAYQEGNTIKAIDMINRAIAIKPSVASYYNNLGNALKDQDRHKEALSNYMKAVRINPNYTGAYLNMGALFYKQNNIDRSIRAYHKSLSIDPDNFDAHFALAEIFQKRKDYNKCIVHYQKVISLRPELISAHINLGGMYLHLGAVNDAEKYFRNALRLESDKADTHFNLGQSLVAQKRYKEAILCYQQAVKIDQQHLRSQYELCKIKFACCDWQNREEDIQTIIHTVNKQLSESSGAHIEPWTLNQIPAGRELQAKAAHHRAMFLKESINQTRTNCAFKFSRSTPDKLKIGYISPDFRNHAVGALTHGMFRYHDRDRFEIYGYTLSPLIYDVYQESVRKGCDAFIDISRISPEEIAKKIYDDGIHILIDLAGYTTFSRPEIFALQPAPIQVQYLGFLNTMGADFIQYTIADHIVMDQDLARIYTEKIVYMPDSFVVTSPMPIPNMPANRSEFGLPDDQTVFCCFNSAYKIEPIVFSSWMKILNSVPKSVLWLFSSGEQEIIDNLRREASQQGVDTKRLIFAETLPMDQHIARCQTADLFLDTFEYNAGATGIMALWSGLPILTLYGTTLLSRMGASFLSSCGLNQLICKSKEEYEMRAIELAANPEELPKLRTTLQTARTSQPLFNTGMFIKHLEQAFSKMWENYLHNDLIDIKVIKESN
ncbi:MAG: tetratricopeptide repeat protein [Spirochaetota bacterium]|nr:tetratricopeptide repeat protein [Spirochaetota bacterium]